MQTKSIYLVIAIVASSASAAEAEKANADQLLREMSAKLAAAKSFRFEATRVIDPALIEGRNLPEKARITVAAQRPNRIVAKSASKGDVRHVYADGRNLTLFDAKKRFYATVPMHTSIDGLVEELDQTYGFTPPLAEFARSDIAHDIRRKAQSVAYLGRSTYPTGFLRLNGVECDRILLSGSVVDAELWVAVTDRLPRKLIVTVKTRPERRQIEVEFSRWNLAAKVTDQEFVFAPPNGALKIPMRTTAETASARR